jgi:hypothetical protein
MTNYRRLINEYKRLKEECATLTEDRKEALRLRDFSAFHHGEALKEVERLKSVMAREDKAHQILACFGFLDPERLSHARNAVDKI